MNNPTKVSKIQIIEISANQESDEVRLAAFCCGSSSSAVSAAVTAETEDHEQVESK